jgi:hypothetical protein
VSLVHEFPSSQFAGGPLEQTPAAHRSVPVQALLSLQMKSVYSGLRH